ncbi:MAG: YhcG family protein [Candidatus Woesearchaeota archaeon]
MKYSKLINSIGKLLEEGRKEVYNSVNTIIVKTYWNIGHQIVEYEQKGKEKATYGSKLLDTLSKDLKFKFGKGFSRRNILDMRRFYINYPNWQTVSAELSWSHQIELLRIDNDLEKSFYEKQCIKENWSVRELSRQINSCLFERIAFSKNKQEVLNISKKGINVKEAKDIIKDPYILEFLNIPELEKYSEKELEQKIIDNLQMFILELGKGFTFVKRQHRITINNTHYYVDLVFYNRLLKCFVLIDLKIGKVSHQDIGQMNLYLNYFKKEENSKEDNEPIGIILSAKKDELLVEYALGGISNKLFISKYKLYLPNKKELENKLKQILI